jgi:hypothetical protein
MDSHELLELSYKHRKHVVFEMNTEGYFFECGNSLLYATFFKYPTISLFLNESAKIVFLSFNGKRTLEEVFNYSYEHFEGIKKDIYFFDFIMTLNMLERYGILCSKIELERRKSIINNKKNTYSQHYMSIVENILLKTQ